MLALGNSVSLVALSRSDQHALGVLLCAGLIALCCSVFSGRCLTATCPYLPTKDHTRKILRKHAGKTKQKNKNRKKTAQSIQQTKKTNTLEKEWKIPKMMKKKGKEELKKNGKKI